MFDIMPFRHNENNLFRYLDEMERNFFNNSLDSASQFRTDIIDRGNAYALQAELPGFDKDDIHISIDNDMLTIQAEHKEEKEEKKDDFVRRERRYGSFSRSFDISNIKQDEISASYSNGILELTLPKAEGPEKKSRQIDIQKGIG